MELSGKPLSLEQIADVAYGREPVQIAGSARSRILASRRIIDDIVARDTAVYGVKTRQIKTGAIGSERRSRVIERHSSDACGRGIVDLACEMPDERCRCCRGDDARRFARHAGSV